MAEQPDEFIESFEPETEVADEASIEDEDFPDLDDTPDSEDIVVETEEPPPLGRSWAFDFTKPGFVPSSAGGPLETRGLATIHNWIEKALLTERGGSPIHDDAYGIENLDDLIGLPISEVATSELRDLVRETLTFHPRISDVVNFSYEVDADSEAMFINFTVILDNENEQVELPFADFLLVG